MIRRIKSKIWYDEFKLRNKYFFGGAAMTNEEKKLQRDQRLEAAMRLEKPDRVPFAPKVAEFPMRAYGINMYDAMMDARNMVPGYRNYIREFDPDAVFMDALYGIPVLNVTNPVNINWPGVDRGLDLDASWQHLDSCFLKDEEYKDFIQDPTHTLLTKVFPRKFENLKGLSKLHLREIYDLLIYNDLAVFADPEVESAMNALMEAGKKQAERNVQMGSILSCIEEEGCSTLNQGAMLNPFDGFADSIRGIIQTCMDILQYPDELDQTLQLISDMNIDRLVNIYKSMGAKRIFMPLHCGVDEFMSPASYEKFYWPHVKRCIMTIIENDMTPIVFCEGNYNSRLEVISDVPKGKVVYMFEKVDLQKAKDIVGKVACICGSVPTATLAFGTKEQIEDATKRQIDILAPGGGFIMDSSITVCNVSRKNMEIWREANLKYGSY